MFRDLWNFTCKYAYWYSRCAVGKVSVLVAEGELTWRISEGYSLILNLDNSSYSDDVVNNISVESNDSNQPSPSATGPNPKPNDTGVKRRNIVDLLCNFKVFDAIIHPSKYTYFPSCFQKPYFMPTSPRESILSMIPTDAFRHRESIILSMIPEDIFHQIIYATPYSTMPFLSSDLENIVYCRKEFLAHSLLPDLISEVTSQNDFQDIWEPNANKELKDGLEQWRTLTRVLEVLYENRHPWYGNFFDIITEFYGRSYRKFGLIDEYIKEWQEFDDLMAHQSRLLQEGGYLDSSSEVSVADYSSGSESAYSSY